MKVRFEDVPVGENFKTPDGRECHKDNDLGRYIGICNATDVATGVQSCFPMGMMVEYEEKPCQP